MKLRFATLLPVLICLPGVPVLAQPAIGISPCNSSTLTGTYEVILSGRQTSATGTVTKLFQAVGTAAFDGLSKITFTLTANTVTTSQSFGTPLTYSGTYSMQTNCVGSISITTGDTATFTLESFNQGKAFAVIGADANYAYNGNGNIQPATCPTTLTGVHEFNGTGNTLTGASATGVLDVAGTLQFDGQGNLTANWTQVANLTSSTVSATGTYTVSSGCLASATATDSGGNKYAISFSIYSTAPDFTLAVTSPQLLFDGSGSAAQSTTAAACSASTLNGTYEIALGGRLAPGGVVSKILAATGAATFDGTSKVTFTLTSNTVNGAQTFGTAVVYSGTYSVQSNCQGSINITTGDTATFALVAYNVDAANGQARAYTLVGTDANYAYNGGGSIQPAACATSTLSGAWAFSGTGNSLSGATSTGVVDLAGILQFDGQGNVTANWTQATNSGTSNVSATGTYTVTSGCLGTISLTDTSSTKYASSISIYGLTSADFEWIGTDPQLIFSLVGRVANVNPDQAIVNAASFIADETPAGSDFSIFGLNLATGVAQPSAVPFPTTLLTTSVTVNGELAPLFYVSPTQINAQMPWDIKSGVATVIVKVGSAASNAAASMIPATGTPGILGYPTNRAVVVNQNLSVNSSTSPAKVGDVLTAYFTGGGPVNASGPLVTGAGAPAGLSPVTGANSVKVSGVIAVVNYIGLTPGSIGLYQANFVVPKVAVGDHPVVITIAGQASNNPVITVGN
jgi:uncharacterized protein (TIGR03437 family)